MLNNNQMTKTRLEIKTGLSVAIVFCLLMAAVHSSNAQTFSQSVPIVEDYDRGRFWLDLIQWICLILVTVYQFFSNRGKATTDSIKKVADDVTAVNNKVTLLEEKISHLSVEETISDLYTKLNALNREMGEFQEKLRAARHLLDVIHEHNLHKG